MDPVDDSNADTTSGDPGVPRSLFYLGSFALLTVMIVETVAVIGRHLHQPLVGALEIVQAAIVPTACAAMAITTICQGHALVHLLVDRLPLHVRRRMLRIGCLMSGIFFAALCAGEIWLTHDFWNSFEETDVLRIPLRPLRILVTVSAGVLAVIFFHRASQADK